MSSKGKSGGGFSDFIWNVIGGGMVSAMIAGVIYVLVGMMATFLNGNDKLWDLIYLKWYFIAVLVVYLIMPTLLANVIGFVFGSTSKASGQRRKIG